MLGYAMHLAMGRTPSPNLDTDLVDRTRKAIANRGARSVARELGLHHTTVAKAAAGGRITPEVANKIASLAKSPPRVREAKEFTPALQTSVRAPTARQAAYSWTIESIRTARDSQMRGQFNLPTQLAEAIRTDDAIFTARSNRLAPQNCIAAELMAAEGARGESLRRKAIESCFVPRTVISSLLGTLVDHGIAIGYTRHETNRSGTRTDFHMTEWPLAFVRWNESRRVLETSTADGVTMDIVHGDGTWTLFQRHSERSWAQEACIMPAALVWAAHAEGLGDWSAGARAHGLAQIMGELPEGISLADSTGAMSPQAQAFLNLLRDIVSGEAGAGIRPYGSKTEFLSNSSTAHQVFLDLIQNREKAAARIYQGTDATLGAAGGAPGVDIAALFGVATTKIQGDFNTIESALLTGFYEPWAAVNAGTSQYAPRLKYQIPDPDAAAKCAERFENHKRVTDTLRAMREQRLDVSQEVVDNICAEFKVFPPLRLAENTQPTSALVLAPASLEPCILAVEVRQAQGLAPFGDERDKMTIDQLRVRNAAKGDIAVDAAATATPVAPAAP